MSISKQAHTETSEADSTFIDSVRAIRAQHQQKSNSGGRRMDMVHLELTQVLDASSTADLIDYNPYDGTAIAHLPQQTPADLDSILARAHAGADKAAAIARHHRAAILNGAADRLGMLRVEIRDLIVAEAGKTVIQAASEVDRAINTLRLSAIEALQNTGELIPFAAYPGSENRQGWFSREPLGLIVAITPYNDALNLVAHKLGPAVAGGNSVVLKPSQQTPLVARALVRVLVDSGLPSEVITVVHGDRELAGALVSQRDVRMVSFTGGFVTGEAIAARAGLKRLSMELGGNSPVIVFGDAEIEAAAEACVSGSFWAAGQNCIGTQRIMVQRDRFEEFLALFVERTQRLISGDPTSENTDVGPMISKPSAREAIEKVKAAVARGATILTGGGLHGTVMEPTVLTDVPEECDVWGKEVFAPIVVLEAFDHEDDVLQRANAVEYSLHAGVFTRDIDRALRVADAIEASGVIINDSSDYRFDAMPFGGAKYGNMGREGVKFAYEDMTQTKVVCINHRPE